MNPDELKMLRDMNVPAEVIEGIQEGACKDCTQMDEYKATEANKRHTEKDHGRLSSSTTGSYGPPRFFSKSTQLITDATFAPNRTISVAAVGASREHQATDRKAHKAACKDISNMMAIPKADEEALRFHKGDADTPRNAFETAVGRFWKYSRTRNYMKARYELMGKLALVNTKMAVQSALDHALGIMHLNPEDPMCVRSITAPLFLRLGKDQECYNLCKWWVTNGCDMRYAWKDRSIQPHRMEADAMESVDVFEQVSNYQPDVENFTMPSYCDLSHVVSVTLVKIRILLDLNALQESKQLASFGTTVDHNPKTLVSSIVANRPEIFNTEDQMARIEELKKQVGQIYAVVQRVNKFFWPALLEPGVNLMVQPYDCRMEGEAEMQMKLQECYNAWAETPGAIEVIGELARE